MLRLGGYPVCGQFVTRRKGALFLKKMSGVEYLLLPLRLPSCARRSECEEEYCRVDETFLEAWWLQASLR